MMNRKPRLLVCAILILMFTFSTTTYAHNEKNEINIIAFGDSICKGYTFDKSEMHPYPAIVDLRVEDGTKKQTNYINYGKNGLNTTKLLDQFLLDTEVQAQVRSADIVLLTIGANDLIDSFKRACQEIIGTETKYKNVNDALNDLQAEMAERPLLIIDVIKQLSNWDYDTFEENWILCQRALFVQRGVKNQMVVTTIYNPTSELELPSTMNAVVDNIISKMNDIIYKHAEEYNYRIADVFDSDVYRLMQPDGVHPNQEGHKAIAEIVINQINFEEYLPVQEVVIIEKEEIENLEYKHEVSDIDTNRILGENKWKRPLFMFFMIALFSIVMAQIKRRNQIHEINP